MDMNDLNKTLITNEELYARMSAEDLQQLRQIYDQIKELIQTELEVPYEVPYLEMDIQEIRWRYMTPKEIEAEQALPF